MAYTKIKDRVITPQPALTTKAGYIRIGERDKPDTILTTQKQPERESAWDRERADKLFQSYITGGYETAEAVQRVKELTGITPIRTVSLPDWAGGGEYKVREAGELIRTPRGYGDMPTKEQHERDHIMSVALAGTSPEADDQASRRNLQYLATTEEGRQEGKVSVEQAAINDYVSGKIDLPEARLRVATKQQEIKGLIPKPTTKEYIGGFFKGLADVPVSYIKEAVIPTVIAFFKKPLRPVDEKLEDIGLIKRFKMDEPTFGRDFDPALKEVEVKFGPRPETLAAIERGEDITMKEEPTKPSISKASIQFINLQKSLEKEGKRPTTGTEKLQSAITTITDPRMKTTLTNPSTFLLLEKSIMASGISAIRGYEGASITGEGLGDKFIEGKEKDIQELSLQSPEIAGFIENLGFSLAAMIPSMVSALGVGVATRQPRAGAMTGAAVSGIMAYRMSSYMIGVEYLKMKNEEQIRKTGKGLTSEQEKQLKDEFHKQAMKYGFAEAVPEAIGGFIGFSALAKVFEDMFSKQVAGKLLSRLGVVLGEEITTEAITEMMQQEIRYDAKLPNGKDVNWDSREDWIAAFAAVAPQTLALTLFTGGAVSIVTKVNSLRMEIGEKHPELFNNFVKKIKELSAQVVESEEGFFLTPGGKQAKLNAIEDNIKRLEQNMKTAKSAVAIRQAEKAHLEAIKRRQEILAEPALTEQAGFAKLPGVEPIIKAIPDELAPSIKQEFIPGIVSEDAKLATISADKFTGKVGVQVSGEPKFIQARNFTDDAVKKWMDRIKKGARPKILVDKEGNTILVRDGNNRLEAYKRLKIENIPVVDNTGGNLPTHFYTQATKAVKEVKEIKPLLIIDKKLTELEEKLKSKIGHDLAGRDEKLLAEELKLMETKEYDGEAENQYQTFKQALSRIYGSQKSFLNNANIDYQKLVKDAKKRGFHSTRIDNILYSREKSGDEVLSMFRDRLTEEKALYGLKTKLSKERVEINRELAASERLKKVQYKKEEQFAKGELRGLEKGVKEGREELLKKISNRAKKYVEVRDKYNLTDVELRKINFRNPRYMNDAEFNDFILLAKEKGELKIIRKKEIENIKTKYGIRLSGNIRRIDLADLTDSQFTKLKNDIENKAKEIAELKNKSAEIKEIHKEVMDKMANLGIMSGDNNYKMIRLKFGITENKNATLNQWRAVKNELSKLKRDFIDSKENITAVTYISQSELDILKKTFPNKSDRELITTKYKIFKKIGYVIPTKERGGISAPFIDFENWKDAGVFGMARETISRNLNAVAGKDAEKVSKFLIDSKRAKEVGRLKFINNKKRIYKQKAKDLKIKAWSKEDEYIQMYGEGRLISEIMREKTIEIMKKHKIYSKTYGEGIIGKRISRVKQALEAKKLRKRGEYHTLTSLGLQGKDISKALSKLPLKVQNRINSAIREIGIEATEMNHLILEHGDKAELELLKKLTPQWEGVVKMADFFRKEYNEILNTINKVRKKYNYSPIKPRKDYFRHFREKSKLFDVDGFDALLGKEDLPTAISGQTEFFRPGKPFNTAQLQRKGDKTTFSGLGGMENYLDTVSKEIFHTETLQRVRALENYIRKADLELGFNKVKLQNFVSNLQEYGNQIAYKKLSLGRAAEKTLMGRRAYTILNLLGSRSSLNMVIGSLSASFTNLIPFTQHLAAVDKKSALAGLKETLTTPFLKDDFTKVDGMESKFLYNRFFEDEKMAAKWDDKGAEIVGWTFFHIDRFTSKTIVAGKYYENVMNGMEKAEALEEAGKYASGLIASRGYAEMPNIFADPGLKQLSRFQLEVNNIYSFTSKDLSKIAAEREKKYWFMLIQFAIFSFLFNEIYEKITGRRVTVDPIDYALTLGGVGDEYDDIDFRDRLRLAGSDLLGDLPFSSLFFEGRFPLLSALPSFKKALGSEDIKKGITKEFIAKPLFYFASPIGGGGQLKKTFEGVLSYLEGGVKSQSGKTELFTIEPGVANFLRMGLFGRWSTPEAREYFLDQMRESDKDEKKIKPSDSNRLQPRTKVKNRLQPRTKKR